MPDIPWWAYILLVLLPPALRLAATVLVAALAIRKSTRRDLPEVLRALNPPRVNRR